MENSFPFYNSRYSEYVLLMFVYFHNKSLFFLIHFGMENLLTMTFVTARQKLSHIFKTMIEELFKEGGDNYSSESPKFYDYNFLHVGFTTLGTLLNFD